MLSRPTHPLRQQGGTLIEVLIALLIASFGLIALAGLQVTMSGVMLESSQRAHALLLMQDMVQRMEVNQSNAADYATTTVMGTGDTTSCTPPLTTRAQIDRCEWSRLLESSSERDAGVAVRSVIDARGCIEPVQAADDRPGVCQPGIYRVSVAWQGFTSTAAPAGACGSGRYGNEALRKLVTTQMLVALPSCS
jgi:type IV pilus assembly protein PilV